MSKIGLSSVITVVAVLSAAAFEIVAAGVVRPALAADPSNGMRVAELWCAACHVVTVNQRQADADAPPFEEIAKRPNFNEPGLVTFLLDPHAKMPNMNLTRSEANDIAAFIGTLR
jgi:mono/diheme cytochrome c family protein